MYLLETSPKDYFFGIHLSWFIFWFFYADFVISPGKYKIRTTGVFFLIFGVLAYLALYDWDSQMPIVHSFTIWSAIATPTYFIVMCLGLKLKYKHFGYPEDDESDLPSLS